MPHRVKALVAIRDKGEFALAISCTSKPYIVLTEEVSVNF